ncbi:MAG: glycerol-3-phosphate dehydrogenase, partial [Pirellulaceae bacterium]
KSSGEEFEILTYHSVMRSDDFVEVVDETGKAVKRFRPAAIVNATGAWVDETLQRLEISSERLMGGTKGTHFITFHPALVKAVQAGGYYVEAGDGRPVFFLKFGEGVLVGTTDLRMEESPGDVRATDLELDYLVDAVQRVFPPFDFGRDDIAMHYCGVRPLPFVPEGSTSAITRRHFVRRHDDAVPPTYSIIGGKLTTARALGEEAAATILKELNCSAIAGSKERLLPGAVSLRSAKGLAVEIERLVKETGCRHSEVIASWPLVGNLLPLYFRSESHFRYEKSIHTEPTLQGESLPAEFKRLAGTPFSCEFVKGLIRREWVTKLDDLVERRLMLLYHPLLRRETIVQLANLLHECGLLDVADLEREVDRNIERMANRYGRRLE